ncbi:MAG: type 1 glutamine amidotransferase [Cyclobacteriaceae bacterium]|jgi:type 1 glutamine amidotransferase
MKNLLLIILGLLFFTTTQAQQFKALVFSKTAGWHHESINEGVDALRLMAKRNNFSLDWEEYADRVFKENYLKKYDVVIFLNTTGDILNDEQQVVFEKFIQSGKGFVGIHSASDTEYDWPWYNELVGMMFYIHPEQQTALIKVEEPNFPGMQLMPKTRWWTDEWYEFGELKSDNLHYLVSVDEFTYDFKAEWGDKKAKGMGFHPISWYHEFDGGRSFYTAMGHIPSTFSDATFLEHIYGGIFWSATGKGVMPSE